MPFTAAWCRVIAVVEGQTERNFVQHVLAPWLGTYAIYLSARLVGKPGILKESPMLSALLQSPRTYRRFVRITRHRRR